MVPRSRPTRPYVVQKREVTVLIQEQDRVYVPGYPIQGVVDEIAPKNRALINVTEGPYEGKTVMVSLNNLILKFDEEGAAQILGRE